MDNGPFLLYNKEAYLPRRKPIGERENGCFRVEFNRKLKREFRWTQVTSDGGLVAVRELDEQLGLTKLAGEYLQDNRYGKKYNKHVRNSDLNELFES